MRSRFGVGTTPPKVLGTPYPWSSVMMRSTLGAPFGGTMRGGHQGVESLALSLITPPNFGGGGGICFPSMVVVALGEPNSPVTCCAAASVTASMATTRNAATSATTPISFSSRFLSRFAAQSIWLPSLQVYAYAKEHAGHGGIEDSFAAIVHVQIAPTCQQRPVWFYLVAESA